MARTVGLTDKAFYRDHIKRAADFVVAHGPAFGNERWEEQSGYSPSTIAAEIAGLAAAGAIADRNGDAAGARIYRATADHYQRNIKTWTVTTTGPLSAEPYFIRLSKTGDPNAAITYNLGNGGPDADQRAVIDAGLPRAAAAGRAARRRRRRSPRSLGARRPGDRQDHAAAGTGFYRYGIDTPPAPRTATATATSATRPTAPCRASRGPGDCGDAGPEQGLRPPLAGAGRRARRARDRDRRRPRTAAALWARWPPPRRASG